MLVLRVKDEFEFEWGGRGHIQKKRYFNEAALAHNPNKLSDN